MATQLGSIAGSSVGITPRILDASGSPLDPFLVQSGETTPGLAEILQNIVYSDRVTDEDVIRKLTYVIDWKIVRNDSSDLLAMLMSQSFTGETSDELNTFEFKYVVDRTGPARETGYNTGPPDVTMETVSRKAHMCTPRAVSIRVPKKIYRRMKAALEELHGLGIVREGVRYHVRTD